VIGDRHLGHGLAGEVLDQLARPISQGSQPLGPGLSIEPFSG
jgi:hypothetical protein